MKKIVYSSVDYGIDGMGKRRVLYSSFDESEIDSLIKKDKAGAWRTKEETIVDVELQRKKALSKLDGIDRLVLGLPTWLQES